METKPAVYSTEFWTHVLLQIIFLVNTVDLVTFMPDKYSGIVQAILGAAYMLARGIAKSGTTVDPLLPANRKLVPLKKDMRHRP
jgi:hypothetical protein